MFFVGMYADNEDGVWRTVNGRAIFIKKGQSLADAMKQPSGTAGDSGGGVHTEGVRAALSNFGSDIKQVKVEQRGPNGKATWITVSVAQGSKAEREGDALRRAIEKKLPVGARLKTGRIGERVGNEAFFDWIIAK